MNTPFDFTAQTPISDPGRFQYLFQGLPREISGLCSRVQDLMLHIHWAEQYGVPVSEKRRQEQDLRKVERQLALVAERYGNDQGGELVPLPKEDRVLGTCRDFSTLLCSMLRYLGIPARARCGFALYFEEGMKTDHWVCEFWDKEEKQWKMADPQLDEFQGSVLNIDFNPVDIPKTRFLTAGEAWLACREQRAEPEHFGILNWQGLWFIKGNLVRDLLSLLGTELLPWDTNQATGPYENHEADPEQFTLFDHIAGLTSGPDISLPPLEEMVDTHPFLAMPKDWQP